MAMRLIADFVEVGKRAPAQGARRAVRLLLPSDSQKLVGRVQYNSPVPKIQTVLIPGRGASEIRSLSCGYSTRGRAEKVLVVFKAFVDDSTSDQDAREMVLAGYIQTVAVWEAFSDDWQRVLDAAPSIKYFRAVEAQNLRDEFDRKLWTPEARDAKVAALSDVIDKHEPCSISVHMSLSQFKSIVVPVAPYDLRHPYHHLMTAVIVTLARWHVREGWKGKIDFIFDEKSEVGPELPVIKKAIWDSLDEDAREVLGSLRHEDDKRVLPLQAADLFAWHLRRSWELRNRKERRYQHGKIEGRLHVQQFLGRSVLRNLAAGMSAIPHVEMTRGKRGSLREEFRDNLPGVIAAIEANELASRRRSAWKRLRSLPSRFLSWIRAGLWN